ncbi:phosphodiester glycosidase family protein [Clostridium omnivorum]|uniref:Phosphodiester glycosidase domain-containing protein n=1 Tax=Clostridium omnivorum TaxID=1604902 RepID=A0ABQ5N686_9CLOT|nr:phosphodiester glycosidase family protein [Clostridium sp. E14]GLC30636.1 hypothetical protein bsdE14_20460 [Clostridium sp. E14]
MNCKSFNKMLLEYIETENSGMLNQEMKEHMEACEKCANQYEEMLEVKASFRELFNAPSKSFTPQNSEILNLLDNKYYKKSLRSKILYHFKRNKYAYSVGFAFTALMIIALPLMKNFVSNPSYAIGKITNKQETTSKSAALTNENSINKYDIKGKNFNGVLLEIANPKKIALGYSLQGSKPNKTTSEIAKSYGAAAAINGGGVLIDAADNKAFAGMGIHDGNIVYSNMKDEKSTETFIGFNQDGKLIYGKYTLAEVKKLGIKEGITLSMGISLVENSKPITLSSDFGVNPRTVIGQKADGTVIMLTINGRREDSIGASLSEVQKILLEYGAVSAINLDGGSYSSMYYNGSVINKPCSPNGEQQVPSIFMVMQ